MPIRSITNPIGAYGLPLAVGTGNAATVPVNDQVILSCINNSGVVLTHGDVVVVDNSAGQMPAVASPLVTTQGQSGAVTTTTSANSQLVMGVVCDPTYGAGSAGTTYAAGAEVPVCVGGVARVQIGANVVTLGTHALATSTTAKQATGVTYATVVAGSLLGTPLESNTAKDANNTIRAILTSM